MADISNLSIAADRDDQTPEQVQSHSVTAIYPGKGHSIAREITADFTAAASGQCIHHNGERPLSQLSSTHWAARQG